jgi:hypothetical protein
MYIAFTPVSSTSNVQTPVELVTLKKLGDVGEVSGGASISWSVGVLPSVNQTRSNQ